MKMKMLQTFFRSRNHHSFFMPIMDLLCATDTAIGIISLPLMSVIYFDSVASLAWVGRNQLNKHILSWKASWLSTTWREWYRIVAMVRKIPPKPTIVGAFSAIKVPVIRQRANMLRWRRRRSHSPATLTPKHTPTERDLIFIPKAKSRRPRPIGTEDLGSKEEAMEKRRWT